MSDAAPTPGASTHWRGSAAQWAAFGSPLHPCAEDVGILAEMLASELELFGIGAKKRAWLLGVTPEIATARWLQDIDLLDVERAGAMIDAAWPGDTDIRLAICADWLHAPFVDEGSDLTEPRTGNYELGERCPHVLPGNRQGASRAGAR